jgi:hypothetical protein
LKFIEENGSHTEIGISGYDKRANAQIFEAIKKILEGKRKGKWAKVMSWAV